LLDTLFHAMVRWAAPVLVFTAEEVWSTRYPDAGSVHLLEWPELDLFPGEGRGPGLDPGLRRETRWEQLRQLRAQVTEAIEPLRRDKIIRSSLEAEVTVPELAAQPDDLAELFIVSSVTAGDALGVTKTEKLKCGRCWRYLPEVIDDGALCGRCEAVVNA
jgi:isoleucyl-tRNA synthetase